MEEVKAPEEKGNIRISDDVIAIIASNACNSIEGVYSMNGGAGSGLAERLGKKSAGKGVKVETKENDAIIDIHIVVSYGSKIPDVAFQIQESVKTAVENTTGMNVLKVNIFVDGVNIPKDVKKSEADPEPEEEQE